MGKASAQRTGHQGRQGNEKGPHGGCSHPATSCLDGRGEQGLRPPLSPALCPQEQSTVRKDAILKMLAGLLDSVDVGREVASPDVEEAGKLEEERAVLGHIAQLSQRDRKAPCKNFFWKTFTSC